MNASPVQFTDRKNRVDGWIDVLKELDLPGSAVAIEITESLLMQNVARFTKNMYMFRDAGIQVSLDDFGTGLSSYSYLRNLPVDYVKIDGVFVKDIANNPGDYAVVRSINEIGHYMGKKTIAEYVEDQDVLDRLLKFA